MSYESGMPMHIAGTTLTAISCTLFPNLIPIAGLMLAGTSNPGMIDACAKHWEEATKKVEEFGKNMKDANDNISKDPKNWSGSDKDAFDLASEKYLHELNKVHQTLSTVHTLESAVALILFILCILTLAVGVILIAIYIAAAAALFIPVVGEAIWAEALMLTVTISELNIPPFILTESALTAAGTFVGLCVAAMGGSYGTQLVSLGTPEPDFGNVTIDMPSPPGK